MVNVKDRRMTVQEELALERSCLTKKRRQLFACLFDESKRKDEIEALEDSAERSANRILLLKDALKRLNRRTP